MAPQAKESCKPVDPERPFVLVIAGAGGPRIAALNEAAEAAGLAVGEPLADARAKADVLQVRAVDAAADDDALRRLALWATRYTPTASPLCGDFWSEDNGADGVFLDVEGASHLFGGEESLIADLAARLDRFGLSARLAVADTPGAAWAASRFHRSPLLVLPSGREAAALADMPIAALRLSSETRT
ncbi:MAG: DNA polymerase Y family protein, partial [Xanthobacteraceae bacterium]